MNKQTVKDRMVWLDWMKTLAILSIIWGHFFSEGHLYLYVFSVQVFCVISGFLYKRSSSIKACLIRCFWGLLVPTFIMSFLIHFEGWLRCMVTGHESILSWPWFFRMIFLGYDWCMGPCWYFFTLAVIRIVMQMLPIKKWSYALFFIMLSIGAIVINCAGVAANNAVVNLLVCMPLFLIGFSLQPFRRIFNSLRHPWVEVAILIGAFVLVLVCGRYNGYVWMYLNGYGNNFILFVLGGMAGTAMLYVVSLWLSRLPYRSMVTIVSKGSILIIGLHIIIVRRLTELPERLWFEDLMAAILIMLCFIPLVQIAERFFPLLLGRFKL